MSSDGRRLVFGNGGRQHTIDLSSLTSLSCQRSFDLHKSLDFHLFTNCSNCRSEYACKCCKKCHHQPVTYKMPVGNKPRVTNLTFSTVTSATGLPTIVAEPSRSRSSSFWKSREDNDRPKLSDSTAVDSPQTCKIGTNGGVYCTHHDKHMFSIDELEQDVRLKHSLTTWSFPIFIYAQTHPSSILTRMAYTVFKQCELLSIFKISPQKFFNFFHALENGYWDIPYHNRIHASDVLHSCYYFTCHPIPACGAKDSLNTATTTNDSLGTANDTASNGEKTGSLGACMSSLERMALFTAAAMHDYDHPGRTNAFLVATEDKMAILYNDRSVLENHHAATSWSLLSRPENYFIDQLDQVEQKRFRYLVIELILATDLKRHFEIIMDFNTKVQAEGGLDLDQEADRMLVSQMCIKQGDINSPTKAYELHLEWTKRICQEFYEQGDAERKLALCISPYMDRDEEQVAKLQDSFIAHIVAPLTGAMDDAGLLPVGAGDTQSQLVGNLHANHR